MSRGRRKPEGSIWAGCESKWLQNGSRRKTGGGGVAAVVQSGVTERGDSLPAGLTGCAARTTYQTNSWTDRRICCFETGVTARRTSCGSYASCAVARVRAGTTGHGLAGGDRLPWPLRWPGWRLAVLAVWNRCCVAAELKADMVQRHLALAPSGTSDERTMPAQKNTSGSPAC